MKKYISMEKIKRHIRKIKISGFKRRIKSEKRVSKLNPVIKAIAVRSFLIIALAAVMVVVLRPQMESIFTSLDDTYFYYAIASQ